MQNQEALDRLHAAAASMELPEIRKTAQTEQDWRWLGRNMGIRNAEHPRFQDAVKALQDLGVTFIMGQ